MKTNQQVMKWVSKITSKIRIPTNNDWDDMESVFFVSTGRTGTKFFARFFSTAYDNVLAYHEPTPDLFDLGLQYQKTLNTPY